MARSYAKPTPSEQILTLMDEFLRKDNIIGVAFAYDMLRHKYPQNATYVSNRVPAKIANYCFRKSAIKPATFETWRRNNEWADSLKESLAKPIKFELTVKNLLDRLTELDRTAT